MIDMILPFVRDMEARAIPPYQQFLRAQHTFVANRYDRFLMAQGNESPGTRLLRYIIQFVDLDYLDQQLNNYDRYSYHIRHIRRDLMNTFDRVERGRGYKNLFFKKSSFYTEEFLFPVEDINSITNLPLDTEDWNVWKHVRPFRIWSYNSEEFTVNIMNDMVRFSSLPPAYAVELIDVVALVFKYFIWNKYQRDKEPAKELATFTPVQLFLHKYVLSPLVWDLADVWLLNMLNKIFDYESVDELGAMDSHSLQVETQYGWVALSSRLGFESLWHICHDVTRNLRPESLMSSKVLFSGSINNRILYTDKMLPLPIQQQYDYLRFIRDKEIVQFYLKVWKSRPNLPATKQILVNVRRDFQRLLRRRPWNVCQDILLKRSVEESMNNMANQVLS